MRGAGSNVMEYQMAFDEIGQAYLSSRNRSFLSGRPTAGFEFADLSFIIF